MKSLLHLYFSHYMQICTGEHTDVHTYVLIWNKTLHYLGIVDGIAYANKLCNSYLKKNNKKGFKLIVVCMYVSKFAIASISCVLRLIYIRKYVCMCIFFCKPKSCIFLTFRNSITMMTNYTYVCVHTYTYALYVCMYVCKILLVLVWE